LQNEDGRLPAAMLGLRTKSIGGQNGTFINVNNPNTGTINGVVTNQLLGVNDLNIAVGFYVDTAGATLSMRPRPRCWG
jgi:hypothetical protein